MKTMLTMEQEIRAWRKIGKALLRARIVPKSVEPTVPVPQVAVDLLVRAADDTEELLFRQLGRLVKL